MNPMLLVGILALCVMPAYAQGQQLDTAKLKADAQNVVKVISGDKLKTQTYCEMLDLNDQIDDANQNQDSQKAKELSEKADELGKNWAPNFLGWLTACRISIPIPKTAGTSVR